jgi:hypothetical protein
MEKSAKALLFVAGVSVTLYCGINYLAGRDKGAEVMLETCQNMPKNNMAQGMFMMMGPQMIERAIDNSGQPYFTRLGMWHGAQSEMKACFAN